VKVLLDSNIWRYLADADAIKDLELIVSESEVELVVVPALIFEVNGLKDHTLRKKILRMLANPRWTRIMPEAFLEAEEIKNIVQKFRAEWIIPDPELSEVIKSKRDWECLENGFWSRAANDIESPATDESMRGELEHKLSRIESKEIRQRMFDGKFTLPSPFNLQQAYGIPQANTPGYKGEPVEYWRVPSLYHIQAELDIYASPYREWIDSEIDILQIKAFPESLAELWYYEISPQDSPRQWIRGAFEFLQSFYKVTPGTPVDSQLSSHLLDVDVVMSADRNFIRFAKKCREDAPFPIAQTYLVSGSDMVAKVLMYLRNLGKELTANK
jgi:hypothetical protein